MDALEARNKTLAVIGQGELSRTIDSIQKDIESRVSEGKWLSLNKFDWWSSTGANEHIIKAHFEGLGYAVTMHLDQSKDILSVRINWG